jgi:formate-dependent nitrite reductase cytochrome c552 subunit
MPVLAIYNSFSTQYASVSNSTELCGQCHGNLRFANTDHLTMNAWKASKHGHGGQADVASELSTEDVGKTPAEVVADENCIACHAPTSIMNNNLTEADALGNFFTTTNGKFTSSTAPQDTSNYPQVACVTCHNPHKPGVRSYFNTSTKKYEVMSSSQELCGQCHGNLRFPGTDHLSYNIEKGTGGEGVANKVTMPGVKCVDCHMHVGTVDGSNSAMFRGHTWKIFVKEAGGSVSASCTVCHSTMTASAAIDTVNFWKAKFVQLDSTANILVSQADSSLVHSTDSTKIKLLKQAQFNLTYAESDESGGVHNHLYTQSLIKDAINKAKQIIATGINNLSSPVNRTILLKNYPNPFNLSTTIEYKLPKAANVTIEVFNFNGQKVKVLLTNKYETAGIQSVKFNTIDLPSGIYFCSLRVGRSVQVIKMIQLP